MMNHPADSETRSRPAEPDVAHPSPVARVPALFLCALAVWALVLAVLALRLLAGQI
jgi:hypothetical protein